MDFGLLLQNRMISVPFELEYVEFGMLTPGIPLPEKSQKECGLSFFRCEIGLYHCTVMDYTTKGGLAQFWELFTMIPCAPRHLKR